MLRIIGPANYGIYSFIYVIIQYILLFSSYGFNFSATKQIAQYRMDKQKISEIYNAAIATRLLISVIISIPVIIIVGLFLKSANLIILLLGLGIVLGDIFIPVWLFQGMEQMRYLTLVNVASKVVFTITIFFVITVPQDYIYIILLNSLGYIAAGIFSTIIVFKHFNIVLYVPSWQSVKYQLSDGFHVFCSTLSMNLYRNSNIFILGLFANDTIVGIYSAAEKVIKAIQGMVSPAAEAFFPHLGHRFKDGLVKDNIIYLIRIAKPFFVLLFMIAIIVYIFAPFISNVLLGASFAESIPLIRLMTLVIIFGGLNYVLGIAGLINLNKQKAFFINVVISGVFSIVSMLILVRWKELYAGGISMVISEIILFIGCSRVLYIDYIRK